MVDSSYLTRLTILLISMKLIGCVDIDLTSQASSQQTGSSLCICRACPDSRVV